MEKREVKFSLVFRDMWQSAGKYVPRVDQLVKVARHYQNGMFRPCGNQRGRF